MVREPHHVRRAAPLDSGSVARTTGHRSVPFEWFESLTTNGHGMALYAIVGGGDIVGRPGEIMSGLHLSAIHGLAVSVVTSYSSRTGTHAIPSTYSKWLSAETRSDPVSMAWAAIQTSLVGIGRPWAFNEVIMRE